MGELVTQVWLKSIKEMSELFYKEVNAQKESLKKTFGVYRGSRMPTKKCAMKMKETNKQRNKKKRRAPKHIFDGRRAFIGRL